MRVITLQLCLRLFLINQFREPGIGSEYPTFGVTFQFTMLMILRVNAESPTLYARSYRESLTLVSVTACVYAVEPLIIKGADAGRRLTVRLA